MMRVYERVLWSDTPQAMATEGISTASANRIKGISTTMVEVPQTHNEDGSDDSGEAKDIT